MTNLEAIIADFNQKIANVNDIEQLEQIRINFLGKKGFFNNLFSELKNLDLEQKKDFGAKINQARSQVTAQIDLKKSNFENVKLNEKLASEKLDVTAPIRSQNQGSIHLISKVMAEIEQIFSNLGFEFAQGPEIEDDFHNFTALNIPKDHPARQMQDSFYLQNSELLLRTHTSNTQIRKMLNSNPPLKIASLGRVFRRDSDQTHTPMFHQFEGFMVDKDVNMGHLKWVLETFLKQFFEIDNVELRFRPSFFPFTEPSAEVDIKYSLDQGKIKIGKGDKFMEILGCGMIHPNVLKNCNIDSENFQAFAFGIGVERLAMLKYGVRDLRMFFENDVRFLRHYNLSL